MRKNIDSRVGLYIDDNECASCSFIDVCPKTYFKCNEFLGWQEAITRWKNFKSDEVLSDE
jgi:hypothetical protein